MLNTARTTAKYLMPGDRIKAGGRFMIVSEATTNAYGHPLIYVRTPNSGDATMVLTPSPSDRFKVYNAKKK